jgi:hypothetical protein
MPEYGSCPIPITGAVAFGVAFVELSLDATGAVSSKRYWNHATEGWEAGPRDDAKHILKLPRLNEDGSDVESHISLLSITRKAMGTVSAVTVVFTLDAEGKPTEVRDAFTRNCSLFSGGFEG